MNSSFLAQTGRSIIKLRITPQAVGVVVAFLLAFACLGPVAAYAAGTASGKVNSAKTTKAPGTEESSESGGELVKAAAKADSTGRAIATSLIGLAFAIAAIVLAFRRDFKEAGGVVAVGMLAVFLASAHGVTVLEDTVNKLFGA